MARSAAPASRHPDGSSPVVTEINEASRREVDRRAEAWKQHQRITAYLPELERQERELEHQLYEVRVLLEEEREAAERLRLEATQTMGYVRDQEQKKADRKLRAVASA